MNKLLTRSFLAGGLLLTLITAVANYNSTEEIQEVKPVILESKDPAPVNSYNLNNGDIENIYQYTPRKERENFEMENQREYLKKKSGYETQQALPR